MYSFENCSVCPSFALTPLAWFKRRQLFLSTLCKTNLKQTLWYLRFMTDHTIETRSLVVATMRTYFKSSARVKSMPNTSQKNVEREIGIHEKCTVVGLVTKIYKC